MKIKSRSGQIVIEESEYIGSWTESHLGKIQKLGLEQHYYNWQFASSPSHVVYVDIWCGKVNHYNSEFMYNMNAIVKIVVWQLENCFSG